MAQKSWSTPDKESAEEIFDQHGKDGCSMLWDSSTHWALKVLRLREVWCILLVLDEGLRGLKSLHLRNESTRKQVIRSAKSWIAMTICLIWSSHLSVLESYCQARPFFLQSCCGRLFRVESVFPLAMIPMRCKSATCLSDLNAFIEVSKQWQDLWRSEYFDFCRYSPR
jgi:hypothetical protein